jgi:glycosyltransferase involved in cell wall biosynthesis
MSERASLPVTVHILTRDSAATLERAIRSAHGCAEILVIDGGSTDDTVAIAKRLGAKVIPQGTTGPLEDFSAARNEGLRHASLPWQLTLDSDEYLSEGFIDELRAITEGSPAAYLIPRRYVLPDGRTVDYASTYPNERLYLFHRDVVDGWIKSVHERPRLKPGTRIGRLQHASLAPVGTPEDYGRKNERYLRIEAARETGGYGHWLRHRVLHTARSRLIAFVRLLGIWLVPRKGVRLPLYYEWPRFRYGWKLILVTRPGARAKRAPTPSRSPRK